MKTVYKILTTGTMLAALVLSNAATSFAQDNPEKTALYEKFLGCYKSTDKPTKDTCFSATAKEFLDKFEKDADEYATFVRKQYDRHQTNLKKDADAAVMTRFDGAVKNPQAVNVDEAFASGKQVLTINPDLLDVPIVLATLGFDNAALKTPNDKYNADAINYAKQAIQMIEQGKPSVTGNYGVYAYSYKTQAFPDGKNNALGWMNYAIGYIMTNRMNQKKEALPYFYKATQINSETKTNPALYQAIGSWYLDEFLKIDKERIAKIEAAGNVDTDETKAMLALQKGYAERAADAYARAYAVAKSDAATKPYKDSMLKRARELYEIRFDKEMSGFDAWLASIATKPFVDPTTAVTPVVASPTTTSAGGTTTTGASTMTNTSAEAATGSRERTATTNGATTTTAKPAPKTPAKKP